MPPGVACNRIFDQRGDVGSELRGRANTNVFNTLQVSPYSSKTWQKKLPKGKNILASSSDLCDY